MVILEGIILVCENCEILKNAGAYKLTSLCFSNFLLFHIIFQNATLRDL